MIVLLTTEIYQNVKFRIKQLIATKIPLSWHIIYFINSRKTQPAIGLQNFLKN